MIFVLKALGSGGIENYLLRFIKFSNNSIEPHVLCTGGVKSHLDDEYKKNGALITYMKIRFFPTFSWRSLIKFLKKNEFDVIVDFTGDFAALSLVSAWKAGITKRIVFYRNSRYTFTINTAKLIYAKICNLFVKLFATKILSNSQAALDYFHPNWNENKVKYEVIYNGVPSEPYLREIDRASLRRSFRIPNNAFVVGHVGRYVAGKNHALILEVAIQLCKKYEDLYFLLCGKDVEQGLRLKIKNHSLEDRIIMPGVVDNIPDVLQIMDIFFFPSTVEGQPNALIEAMLSNLPIVASDIGPIKECVPPMLIDSLISLDSDPNTFLIEVESLYNAKNMFKNDTRSWAKKTFSPDKNFIKFLKHLV